ncbi:MAG: phosphotransferase [Deltaproteobacteria bacterium]|jgi:phosphate uptake regulator|nr:phosphotransferase [Deltaproteobacteria bacterium]
MPDEIRGGFKILANEVLQAAGETRDLLKKRDPAKSRDLYHRVSYVSTQVALLQKQTMELLLAKPAGYKGSPWLRGISSIASRLERISDILLNLDKQAGFLKDPDFLKPFRADDFFHEIIYGLGKIVPALETGDVSLAIRLGQVEESLDTLYAERFGKIVAELKSRGDGVDDLVTTLMIVHYLERVGDMLLEIGEKIIYVIMGEKIKLEQYKALGAGLKATGQNLDLDRLAFKSIWGGRSGCRIGVAGMSGHAETADSHPAETVLFKHGSAYKLSRERENLIRWSNLRPGLTPKVKAFVPAKAGGEAALILEYVPARNLQSLFLENATEAAVEGLRKSVAIMTGLWRETMTRETSLAGFVRQAESKLNEARSFYPHLVKFHGHIGGMEISPIAKLLEELRPMEARAFSDFSMTIHGDFNLSNVLYDPANEKVCVLDLYRSRKNDYVQDVSVMLVSILRLPVWDKRIRRGLTDAALMTREMARDFALELRDETFDLRLAYGLARSFLTSTRFILEEKTASVFVARARYILEKLRIFHRAGKPLESFGLSPEVLRLQIP